jgi:ribonuclease BN (tRNA processing enzyme)
MKLYTLGTGSCTINPTHYNTSTLVEINDSLYLIDAGTPVDASIIRAEQNIKNLRAIFITHMHLDHVGGLPNLMRAVFDSSEKPEAPVSVFLPESSAYDALYSWLKAARVRIDNSLFQFKVTSATPNLYSDENIVVEAIPTDHIPNDPPITYAYTIESSEGSILATGDLCSDLHDFPAVALERNFDVCVCEATHYQPEDALSLFSNLKIKHMILTHIHTPWQTPAGQTELREAYQALPYPVDIAFDGAEYSI